MWADKGRVLVFQDPKFIPGLSATLAEVLRFQDAYLVKPDLKRFILKQRKTSNGVLIHRIQKELLSVFLKPGNEAILISESVDLDLTIEVLLNGRKAALKGLTVSEQADVIRDVPFNHGRDKEIDLVMMSQGMILRTIGPAKICQQDG